MTTPVDLVTHERARHQRPTRDARAPSRPSFANALRQRGLMAKAVLPGSMASAWSGASSTWLAVTSIYEAHMRRVLMEQAQETLRGDVTG
jgi:hypothetical protein